jgi:Zn-dependent protease/CBS domain-containing protein
VHPTWFIIFALITTSLVTEFAREFSNRGYALHVVVGLLASVLFFGSVLFHEMAHSLLARKMGHPVHGITLFVFGGIAEISEEAHTPGSEFWIAVIGPFSSFFLSGVFFVIHYALLPLFDEMASAFETLGRINLALGIFNLVPAFPLDGGRVLRSIFWRFSGNLRTSTRRAARVGQTFGYLMITVGILIAFGTGNLLNGLWIAFIGWFLTSAAQASIQQVELQHTLKGLTARDIMARDCPTVSEDMSLFELVENHILPTGCRGFLVTEGEKLAGLITLHEVKQILRNLWPQVRVRDAMKKAGQLQKAAPDTRIEKILQMMDDGRINQIPVVEDHKLVGVISREHLLNMIRTRIALEEQPSGRSGTIP